MDAPLCPTCGRSTLRAVRPMTINYKGLSTTFDMPGWYCACGEGIVNATDMEVSDRQLNLLKAQVENRDTLRKTDAFPSAPTTGSESADTPETHPLACIAGCYANNPNWDDFVQALEAARRKLDEVVR